MMSEKFPWIIKVHAVLLLKTEAELKIILFQNIHKFSAVVNCMFVIKQEFLQNVSY